MLSFNKITVPDKLKSYVKSVWHFDARQCVPAPGLACADNDNYIHFPNFADGNPGIIFQQFSEGVFDCGKDQKIPPNYVFGQTVKPINLFIPQNCTLIGVTFHPHVLPSIFRFNAKEITDGAVDLNLLPSVPRINLSEQLWNTKTPQGQADIVFRYLEYMIGKNNTSPDKALQYAVEKIVKHNGRFSIKSLQHELNMTERTLERKFEQHVGISSRLLSGIAQFQASLKQLRSGNFSKLSDIAYDNGFADQSHFIRTFKKFAGLSPLQLHKQLTANDRQLIMF